MSKAKFFGFFARNKLLRISYFMKFHGSNAKTLVSSRESFFPQRSTGWYLYYLKATLHSLIVLSLWSTAMAKCHSPYPPNATAAAPSKTFFTQFTVCIMKKMQDDNKVNGRISNNSLNQKSQQIIAEKAFQSMRS